MVLASFDLTIFTHNYPWGAPNQNVKTVFMLQWELDLEGPESSYLTLVRGRNLGYKYISWGQHF